MSLSLGLTRFGPQSIHEPNFLPTSYLYTQHLSTQLERCYRFIADFDSAVRSEAMRVQLSCVPQLNLTRPEMLVEFRKRGGFQ